MKITIQSIKQKATPILKRYGVSRASLFGSIVRCEEKNESDIDILVEPPKGMTLFNFASMKLDLEKCLKKQVDVITYRSVHPLLKKYILADQKIIYEKR